MTMHNNAIRQAFKDYASRNSLISEDAASSWLKSHSDPDVLFGYRSAAYTEAFSKLTIQALEELPQHDFPETADDQAIEWEIMPHAIALVCNQYDMRSVTECDLGDTSEEDRFPGDIIESKEILVKAMPYDVTQGEFRDLFGYSESEQETIRKHMPLWAYDGDKYSAAVRYIPLKHILLNT